VPNIIHVCRILRDDWVNSKWDSNGTLSLLRDEPILDNKLTRYYEIIKQILEIDSLRKSRNVFPVIEWSFLLLGTKSLFRGILEGRVSPFQWRCFPINFYKYKFKLASRRMYFFCLLEDKICYLATLLSFLAGMYLDWL